MLPIAQETIVKDNNTKYSTSRLSISGLLLMCLLFLFVQVEAKAQIKGLSKGDRVKITIKGKSQERFNGYVVQQSSFAIQVLHNKTKMSFPFNAIESIYIKRGEKRRTGLGFGVGLVSGGIVGALHVQKPPCSDCFDLTGMENLLRVSGGAAIGALTGALIGAMFKGKRWQRLTLSNSLKDQNMISRKSIILPSLNFRVSISGWY